MPFVSALWSAVLFVLQRGTTGVTIFFVVWAAILVVMLDDVSVVSYQKSFFSGQEEMHVKLDPSNSGITFVVGATSLIGLSVLTFFVKFYHDPEANAGVRVLFGVIPPLLAAILAYFSLQP